MGKHSRQRDISAKDLGWEEAGDSLEAERGPRGLSEGEGCRMRVKGRPRPGYTIGHAQDIGLDRKAVGSHSRVFFKSRGCCDQIDDFKMSL